MGLAEGILGRAERLVGNAAVLAAQGSAGRGSAKGASGQAHDKIYK